MIVFDGITLESVAPVRVEDIRVMPVEYSPTARPRAIFPGSEFVRMRNGTRTVSITFAVLVDDFQSRQEYLANISMWAKSDAEYKLELPTRPNAYLTAVCTGKPEPSFRQWWESKLRLTFTCYDNPFWTSNNEKSVACGTEFYVFGDAPPLMKITRTLGSSASNQAYSNGTETMTFSTLAAGNLVIDLNKQTAKIGSASTMSTYKASSKFLIPRTGRQTITGSGTVVYRERWL